MTVFTSSWLTYISMKLTYVFGIEAGILPPLSPMGVLRWMLIMMGVWQYV